MINQIKIIKCSCNNPGQDHLYGQQNRMTTPCNKRQTLEQTLKQKTRTVRCTVCTKEQEIVI